MFGDTDDPEEGGLEVSGRLFGFLVVGFLLVFAGIIVLVVVSVLSGSGSVGGVILIGPIPIIFGSGPDAFWLVLIGVIVTVFCAVLFLVMNKRLGKNEF